MTELLAPHRQPVSIDSAILQTADLERLRQFYEGVVGLEALRWSDDEALELGAQGRRLLTLREDKSLTPNDPQEAGLFHLAFLLPSRRDLAHWLRAAAEQAAPIVGASDHGVSEAVYLHDPDGNFSAVSNKDFSN